MWHTMWPVTWPTEANENTRVARGTLSAITVGSSNLCTGPKFRAAAPNIVGDQNFSVVLDLLINCHFQHGFCHCAVSQWDVLLGNSCWCAVCDFTEDDVSNTSLPINGMYLLKFVQFISHSMIIFFSGLPRVNLPAHVGLLAEGTFPSTQVCGHRQNVGQTYTLPRATQEDCKTKVGGENVNKKVLAFMKI